MTGPLEVARGSVTARWRACLVSQPQGPLWPSLMEGQAGRAEHRAWWHFKRSLAQIIQALPSRPSGPVSRVTGDGGTREPPTNRHAGPWRRWDPLRDKRPVSALSLLRNARPPNFAASYTASQCCRLEAGTAELSLWLRVSRGPDWPRGELSLAAPGEAGPESTSRRQGSAPGGWGLRSALPRGLLSP